jgi:hypothetical protein
MTSGVPRMVMIPIPINPIIPITDGYPSVDKGVYV